MDMISFLVGFIASSLLWLFVAAAYSAGKQAENKELARKSRLHD